MSLLNYVYHANPTSHKDVLSKLKAFAIAQGWSSDEYLTDKNWSNGWVTGTGDFLQLSTNGYGSQDAIFRLYFEGTGADSLAEDCYFRGITPGNGTYNASSATPAYNQNNYNNWAGYGMPTLPSGSHVACWFFGNSKIIVAVDQVSTTTCVTWIMGVPELFDAVDECYWIATSTLGNLPEYYNIEASPGNWNNPWFGPIALASQGVFWYDGSYKTTSEVKFSSSIHYNDAEGGSTAFTKLFSVINHNSFSGKRPLIKPTLFIKKSTSLWHPVASFPLYQMDYTGLTFGQEVTYGSETYICFPNCDQSRKYGTAIRIV